MLIRNFSAITIFFIFAAMNSSAQLSFKQEQLNHIRVKDAFEEKDLLLSAMFLSKGLPYPPKEIFLRAFKLERDLEVWVWSDLDSQFVLLHTYDICDLSGKLGPKRKQGDKQIPEGFYHIRIFNPESSFHLSLGLDYPNESDRILSNAADLGGDIYIHGDCVTIGCLPITDDKIKELYCLSVLSRDSGQTEIPVHIFPARLDKKNTDLLKIKFGETSALYKFWLNLKPAYDHFEIYHCLPAISVATDGDYLVW